MQNIVHSHQGNSARETGRLVLLQNSLPEPSGRLCRPPEKVLLLQINLCQFLSRALLMQINRALPRKSFAESPAKGFLMQNKASGLPASHLKGWEKAAGAPARDFRHPGQGACPPRQRVRSAGWTSGHTGAVIRLPQA
jgi:hypothetical protein